MSFHNACIIGAAVYFGLAAFAVVVHPFTNLPMLGMCFFAPSFYIKTP